MNSLMQKRYLILFLFLLVSFNLLAQVSSTPRINVFIESSLENSHHLIYLDNDATYKTNTNLNVGVDILILQHKSNIKFGLGFLYQFPTSVIGQEGNYSVFPFYSFVRLNIIQTEFITPTIQLKLGYNVLSGDKNYLGSNADLKGGLYYSVGSVLIMKNNFQIRIFYSVNYGKYITETNNNLIKNNQLSIGLGWGF